MATNQSNINLEDAIIMHKMEMMTLQDPQNMPDVKPSTQVSHDAHGEQHNKSATEAPIYDYCGRKVSRGDIQLVQNLIERCVQLYMNRDEVVETLLTCARINPEFTALVWKKLEEENAEFFRAYHISLKLKKQIILFNNLLEHQYHLMKYPVPAKVPLAPIQNGIHPMPVNNLAMGYLVMQQPPIPSMGPSHLDSMGCGLSSCHVVNGVRAPGNDHPICMNSGSDMLMNSAADIAPVIPLIKGMSEMALSPESEASSGHFPFTPSEMSGMSVDTSVLDTTFTSDVACSVGLQLGPDNGSGNGRDSLGSLANIPWNFSLSDLEVDLSNLGDSPERSPLIQDKGTSPLGVKISPPDHVQLENNRDQLQEKEDKKVRISIRKDNKNGLIVSTVKGSYCTIDFGDLMLHDTGKKANDTTKSAFIDLTNKVPSVVLIFIVAVMLVTSTWMCLKASQW